MSPKELADQYYQIHALENELYATPAQHAMLDLAMAVHRVLRSRSSMVGR